MNHKIGFMVALSLSMGVAWGATYNVTTGSNPGPGSLNDAIVGANNHSGPDTIVFDIESMSDPPYYIYLENPLPAISDNSTFINGFSQPGSEPNTGGIGQEDNAVLGLIFDGNNMAQSQLNGFTVTSDSNEICGFMFLNLEGIPVDTLVGIPAFDSGGCGIHIKGGGYNHVWGCRFGLDTTGLKDRGNFHSGIVLNDGAHHNLVGGSSPEERNVLAGNGWAHISIMDEGSDANVIAGNFIGPDVTGSSPPDNLGITGYGVWTMGTEFTSSPQGTVIGGADSTFGNVISANPQDGVYTWGNQSGSEVIANNRIGVGITGEELGNLGSGIHLDRKVFGDSILANVIAYNHEYGVMANDTNSSGHVMIGNRIINNQGDGVRLFGLITDCQVTECEIAGNQGNGIYVAGPGSDRNLFSQNSIYENDSLGIDLAPKGVTKNDASDSDEGPNQNMNFPLIDSAATTRIYGRMQGISPAGATVEAYLAGASRSEVDPSDYGEARTYLGTGTVEADKSFVVITSPTEIGNYVSATATDTEGNTSELAKAVQVTKVGPGVEESKPRLRGPSLEVELTQNRINLSYRLSVPSRVRLAIYDASGSLVAEPLQQPMEAGLHRLWVDARSFSAGTYFARLQAGEERVTAKFEIIR